MNTLAELRKVLRREGYRKVFPAHEPFDGTIVSIYEECRHRVVAIEQITMPCAIGIAGGLQNRPTPTSITDFFRRLKKWLSAMTAKLNQTTLVLPGGGTVSLPKAFRDWAKRQGIQVVIAGTELPKELVRRLGNNRHRRAIPKPFVDIVDALDAGA